MFRVNESDATIAQVRGVPGFRRSRRPSAVSLPRGQGRDPARVPGLSCTTAVLKRSFEPQRSPKAVRRPVLEHNVAAARRDACTYDCEPQTDAAGFA